MHNIFQLQENNIMHNIFQLQENKLQQQIMAKWSFSRRLLEFHHAHTRGRHPNASCDPESIANDFKTCGWQHAKCFHSAHALDSTVMIDYMRELDVRRRVDPTDEFVDTVSKDVHKIVEGVIEKLSAEFPIFKGRLLRMGSSHNGLKVGAPDEYDFCLELDFDSLLRGAGKFEGFEQEKGRFILYLQFDGDPRNHDIVHFIEEGNVVEMLSLNGANDAPRYRSAVGKRGDRFILNTESVAFAFFNSVDKVLREYTLPLNWQFGGFNQPNFSGLRLNMPAYTLQLGYKRPDDQDTLMISVDIAPILLFSSDNITVSEQDVVNHYLRSSDYAHDVWFRLDCGTYKGAVLSTAEETWLSTYDFGSIAKTSIRICKILHSMIPLTQPRYMPRYLVTQIIDYQKRKMNKTATEEDLELDCEWLMNNLMSLHLLTGIPPWTVHHLEDPAQYITFRDLGENGGGHEYISSYIYKRLVMTLMALDEHAGRHWTAADLPNIIVSVFLFINDLIFAANQSTMLIVPVQLSESDDGSEPEEEDDSWTEGSKPTVVIGHLDNKPDQAFNLVKRSVLVKQAGEAASAEKDTGDPQQEDLESESDDGATFPEPPSMYAKLKSALTSGKCAGIAKLFLKDAYSRQGRQPGLDEYIACVLETIASTELTGGKYVPKHVLNSEEDLEELRDTKKCLVRKSEIKLASVGALSI